MIPLSDRSNIPLLLWYYCAIITFFILAEFLMVDKTTNNPGINTSRSFTLLVKDVTIFRIQNNKTISNAHPCYFGGVSIIIYDFDFRIHFLSLHPPFIFDFLPILVIWFSTDFFVMKSSPAICLLVFSSAIKDQLLLSATHMELEIMVRTKAA